MQDKLNFQIQNFIQSDERLCQSLADKERSKRRDNLFFLAISFFALTVMLVIIVLNTYVFFIADVSGSSMYPTLKTGDKLVVNRYKDAEINSIVIIEHTKSNGQTELWIKRVIAEGGDTVEIVGGYVYVNGALKDESYLSTQGVTEERGYGNKWVLAEDEIFFLGDNRKDSEDARIHGPCKESDVMGVIENWSLWLLG